MVIGHNGPDPATRFAFFVETSEAAPSRVSHDDATDKSPALKRGLVDMEHNKRPDGGYGGWVELPDGNLYAVNGITDDAPDPRLSALWQGNPETLPT